MIEFQKCLPGGLIAATLLSGCGGDSVAPDPAARAEVLMSSERGMNAITLDGKNAYLSLTNTAIEGTAVLSTARALDAKSVWSAVPLGDCRLPVNATVVTRRAPELKQVGGKTMLIQPAWGGPDEHTLCELDQAKMSFVPKDKDFRICYETYCERMEVGDVKAVGTRLFANAGGAQNLQVSTDQGGSWRPIMGSMDSMSCTHQSFHLVGDRLLTGGECPLDIAFVRAYQMKADGSDLVSKVPIALAVPELENRNVQFITSFGNGERVYVGVEGGLLRSDDGGRSFKFAMRQPLDGGGNYYYITQLISPANKPNVIVAAGFDKAKGLPYMGWSSDNGEKWTDLSPLLPGYKRGTADTTGQVTAMAEDAQGRILVTVNEDFKAKGRLVAVTLGHMDPAR